MFPPATKRLLSPWILSAAGVAVLLASPAPAPAQNPDAGSEPPASPAQASTPKAEPKNENVAMFMHLIPKDQVQRVNCFHHGVETATDVMVQGDVPEKGGEPKEYLAFLLIAGFDTEVGLAAVQFGVAYDPREQSGVDIVGWQDCAALEWHADDWPGAGTGNLLTWNQREDCQHDEPVVVGMMELRVYGPDRLVIIPRPVDNKALIAGCGELTKPTAPVAEFKPENLGFLGFGDKRGYNPWDPKQNLLQLRQHGFQPNKE